ncbi:MAG: hypothetical protein ACREAF_06730, partial [Nitrosopumilaceae archaeon]
MKTIFLAIVGITLLSITGLNQSAHACSCVAPAPPKESLEKSDAVFLGRVVEIKKDLSNIVSSAQLIPVKFEVQRVWKGPAEKTITVSTALSSASCGYEFQEGETYLVYAYGKESLQTGLCTRTQLFVDVYEDLRALGAGTIPINVNTTIPIDENPKGDMTIQFIAAIIGGVSIVAILAA